MTRAHLVTTVIQTRPEGIVRSKQQAVADNAHQTHGTGRSRPRRLARGACLPGVFVFLTACPASRTPGFLDAGQGDPEGTAFDARPAVPDAASRTPIQPAGWDDQLRLPEAPDLNADAHIVEIALEAKVSGLEFRAGLTTNAWTYGGTVPGPLIRLRRGNRLIVHFTNHLPEATTVHWHGLRIPAAMDGVPVHSQAAIPPGGTFDYDFVVPDAGLFWYHPHVHSAGQVGDGLYGALLVEDPLEPQGFGDPLTLVLSDLSLEKNGDLGDRASGGDVGSLFGREGDLLLVNGRVKPVLRARVGVRQRWRIVNSARTRYFQLALEGHRFVRVGGDGGLLPRPVDTERLVLAPGERADIAFVPTGEPGRSVPLRWVPYDRGYGTAFKRPEEILLVLDLAPDPAVVPTPLPTTLRTIEPLDISGATQVDIRLTMKYVNSSLVLGINDLGFDEAKPFTGHVGETQVWNITNEIAWDHPFHLHGFFFQVLGTEPLEWKDTANVPVKTSIRIAVKYDNRPGMWMFHCHILDHADAGMMGMLMLSP